VEAQKVVHEETGGRRLRELGQPGDLDAGELAAAQCQDPEDAQTMDAVRGAFWPGRTVLKACGARGAETGQLLLGRADRDPQPGGDLGDGLVELDNALYQLGSTQRGVSLALRWAFMRGWFLDRRCFHNPIVPAPPRMNNLLQPSHLVPPQPYARDRTQPTFFARSRSDPTAPVRFVTTLPTRL
jgi:hypothetical protein